MEPKISSGLSLPDWLYEALPYLYVAIGLVSVLALRNIIGIASGLLLISASIVIWNMRRNFRAKASTAVRRRDSLNLDHLMPEDNAQAVRVVWHPDFSVGHDAIDRQHRQLFALGNDLIGALVAKKSKADIDLVLDDLARHLQKHFRTEEEVFLRAEEATNDEHRQSHSHLLKEVARLQTKLWDDHLTIAEVVAFIVHDVISEHVTKEIQALKAINAA